MNKFQFLSILLLLLLLLSFGAKAQKKPFFAFNENNAHENTPLIKAEIKKYIIKIGAAQQEEILSSLLSKDVNPSHYLTFAQHFPKAFDATKRKKIAAAFPDWVISENMDFSNEWSSENGDYYSFCGLDFDEDGKADLFLLPQVFFGPSPGLAIYGYQKGAITYLLSISGDIVFFKKQGKDFVLQYAAMLIENTETEILQTIVYRAKSKSCYLDSKIYYATQTQIPAKLNPAILFKTIDSVTVRYDKKLNDSIYTEEDYNNYELGFGTKTIRGNVVAVYPKNASGYILAEDKDYAFVVFKPESNFLASSLRHGMENFHFEDSELTYEPNPKPYICGWVEKRWLKKR